MEAPTRRNSVPIDASAFGRILSQDYAHYAAADAINAHGLMNLLQSPAYYQWRLSAVQQPSEEMVLGTALDLAITEPERFAATVRHGDRRKVKAEPGQIVLTEARWACLQGMLAGIERNPAAQSLLAGRLAAQPTVYWTDPVHQVACKARLDLICQHGRNRVAVDIKTAADAAEGPFSRACANYHYDLQVAHYLEAGRVTGLWHPHLFFFVVLSKAPPYDCIVYQAGDSFLGRGTADRDHTMQLYASCRAAGDWPGPPAFQTLELPPWAQPADKGDLPPSEAAMPDIDLAAL